MQSRSTNNRRVILFPVCSWAGRITQSGKNQYRIVNSRIWNNGLLSAREALVLERLAVNGNLLAVQQDKGHPHPLVCVVPPKMVGSPLDASVAGLHRPLVTRVELELNFSEQDDAVIERLCSVHRAADTRGHIDEADD